MTTSRTHLDQIFAELQTDGLSPVHAAMSQNIIENRIRGNLPYTARHLEAILSKIERSTPDLVDRVKRIFKNAGA